jgi:predicted PurR-regulated permease PerM
MSADPVPPPRVQVPTVVEPPQDRVEGRMPLSVARLRRSTWWWVRTAAIAATAVLLYQLLVIAGSVARGVLTVILYVIFGAVVAFVAGPAVDAMVRWLRLPRTLAILIALIGGLGLIGLLVYLVAGPVVTEARALAGEVPQFIARAQSQLSQLGDFLKKHGLPVSGLDIGASDHTIASNLSNLLLSSLTGTLSALVDVAIVFVVAFWLLKDGDKLRAGLIHLIPVRARGNTEFALDAVGVVIGGYVRAQLLLALIIGCLAGVGCAVIGVPFPLVVALAAGIFELVPIVGPFVGGAVALLLAATVSVLLAVATLVLFLGIHILEGYVLAPRIQARFVQLHPLIALLALFAGVEVAGFLGALFAVPAASLVAVYARAAIGDIRASRPDLYAARRPDAPRDRRRQRLLGEFSHSPLARLRGLVSRRRGTGDGPGTGVPPSIP